MESDAYRNLARSRADAARSQRFRRLYMFMECMRVRLRRVVRECASQSGFGVVD
ncbi:hypothetical protein bcgnr5380_59180 [Bacillus cereus]